MSILIRSFGNEHGGGYYYKKAASRGNEQAGVHSKIKAQGSGNRHRYFDLKAMEFVRLNDR